MRRIAGLVCIFLGTALIGLAIALPSYVYPRVARPPVNPDIDQLASGTGVTVLLVRGQDEGGPRPLTDQTVLVNRKITGEIRDGAPQPGSDRRFYRLAFSATAKGAGLIQAYVEGGSFDNRTGLADNCCGDYLRTDANDTRGQPIDHQGLLFTFPFDTQRRNYPFWDVNIRSATLARYDGTEEIDGLLTYRFVQNIADEVIGQQDLPGSLINLPQQSVKADDVYSNVRTLWVEPTTGAIVKGQERINRILVAQGKQLPSISGTLVYTPGTVASNVSRYGGQARQLKVVSSIGPIVGWILGPVLLLAGIALLVASRRRDQAEDEWADDEEYQDA